MISALQIGLSWSGKTAGGADRVYADLAASLPGAGVRFIGAVAGPENLNQTTDGLIHSFATEEAGTLARLLGAREAISKLLKSEKPEIVASHFALYAIPILDKLSDQPFVMHFHGPWALESKEEGASRLSAFTSLQIENTVYRRADRAIVLSKEFASLLNANYGVPEEKIRIVPGSVDLDRFTPRHTRTQAREILGWPIDRPTLLTVRRLVNRMGLNNLLEAIPRVRERVPDVLLCIGGIGPNRDALNTKVVELGLTNNVSFLGFIPDNNLPIVYRAADISVVPSIALEGFGLVAAESLASGTPAMVTPVGGLPGVVEGLSKDLIFRSSSPRDVADSLAAALRSEISLPTETNCREYAARSFSRELMASSVARIYRELVS